MVSGLLTGMQMDLKMKDFDRERMMVRWHGQPEEKNPKYYADLRKKFKEQDAARAAGTPAPAPKPAAPKAPAPTAPVAPVAPAAPAGNQYEVKGGDSMSKIAQGLGISLQDLIKKNPSVKDPNKIKPGQKLNY